MPDQPLRILIVDDNIADVALLLESLREESPGCEIAHVENGERALDYLLQRREYVGSPAPDLVILDLNMPRIDGHEVLKFIRSTPHLSGVPVSILSSSPHDIARAALLHPDYIFQKPFDLDEFLSLAKDILGKFRKDQGKAADMGIPLIERR